MKVTLAQIGNSKGVRIPKSILAECNFTDEAELEVKKGSIILTPITQPRSDWQESAQLHKEGLEVKWEW